MAIAALLTSTSIGPCAATAAATMPSTADLDATSATTATAVPPAAVIASTTSSARAGSTSFTATLAPSAANRSATARPMPWPAPVTSTLCPANRPLIEAPSSARIAGIVAATRLRWCRADHRRPRPVPGDPRRCRGQPRPCDRSHRLARGARLRPDRAARAVAVRVLVGHAGRGRARRGRAAGRAPGRGAAAAARAAGAWVLAGTVPERRARRLFNTAVLVRAGRTAASRCTARCASTRRSARIARSRPETALTVVAPPGARCRSASRRASTATSPRWRARCAAPGARIVLHPAAYEVAAERWWDVLYPANALANGQWWISVNQCGDDAVRHAARREPGDLAARRGRRRGRPASPTEPTRRRRSSVVELDFASELTRWDEIMCGARQRRRPVRRPSG